MKNMFPFRTGLLMSNAHTEKAKAKTEKLEKAIKEAEGKATARCITVDEICRTLSEIEKHFNGISHKMLKDVSVICDVNAQHFAKAYKYKPMSTIFEAIHNGKEWMITAIYRGTCTTKKVSINLTKELERAILDSVTIISADKYIPRRW